MRDWNPFSWGSKWIKVNCYAHFVPSGARAPRQSQPPLRNSLGHQKYNDRNASSRPGIKTMIQIRSIGRHNRPTISHKNAAMRLLARIFYP
eukprot:6473223-Pyramimonas_sp.AAC.2